jgi:chemotaxis protein methyltransferase CheR
MSSDLRLGSTAEVLELLLGFRFEPTRKGEVEAAVRERMSRRGMAGLEDYARLLAEPEQRAIEARCLADLTTINETYFLREPQHHEIFLELVRAPSMQEPARQPLQVLSLGCSTGEEPYSIAMTLREAGFDPQRARVHAVDASPTVIARAERGCYSDWSLRNVSESQRARYFVRSRAGNALCEDIKAYVRFEVRNALEEDDSFWKSRRFDFVFCRNVLIYFTPQAAREVVRRCAQVLAPEGYLFLGHSETGHASRDFQVQQARGAFFFKRGSAASSTPARTTLPRERRPVTAPRRVAARGASRAAAAAHVLEASRSESLLSPRFWRLWQEKQLSQVAAELVALPQTPELCLLRAALLTQQGQLDEARSLCLHLLSEEPTLAAAHQLLGMAREHVGDLRAASQHYRRAAALDPDFALAILRAGILARRLGEPNEARRLLREAVRLMPYQSERTLLLFGGGFSADALLSLGRSELLFCGGSQ